MTDDTGSAALTALRSEILLQLGEMRGDIRLILQSIEHQADRAEEHRQSIGALDGRVDAIERTVVTRDELAEVVAQMRALVDQARAEAETAVAKVRAEAAEQRAADQRRADRRLTIVGIALGAALTLLSIAVAAIGIIAR